MMKFNNTFIMFALVVSMSIGTIFAITPAFAEKSSGSNGLERSDEMYMKIPKD